MISPQRQAVYWLTSATATLLHSLPELAQQRPCARKLLAYLPILSVFLAALSRIKFRRATNHLARWPIYHIGLAVVLVGLGDFAEYILDVHAEDPHLHRTLHQVSIHLGLAWWTLAMVEYITGYLANPYDSDIFPEADYDCFPWNPISVRAFLWNLVRLFVLFLAMGGLLCVASAVPYGNLRVEITRHALRGAAVKLKSSVPNVTLWVAMHSPLRCAADAMAVAVMRYLRGEFREDPDQKHKKRMIIGFTLLYMSWLSEATKT